MIVSQEWSLEDYAKYHIGRIEKILNDLSYIGLNEASMQLDGQLTSKLHLAMIEDRSKGMEELFNELIQLKDRVYENNEE